MGVADEIAHSAQHLPGAEHYAGYDEERGTRQDSLCDQALRLGAAIGGRSYHSYYAAPPPSYYYGPSYYSYYGGCHSEWRWDRYYHRYVPVERCY